jgi:VCBS repeat-containing protein
VGDASAGGDLNVSDVDDGEAAFGSTTTLLGTYGSFVFNLANGTWTYTLDNNDADTQALITGQSVSDSLTVYSLDNSTSHTITVTINGADDGVSVPPVYTGTGDPNDFDSATATASGTSATNGNDTILGTSGADTINLQGGDDVYYAGAGNDGTVSGQNGNDSIYGQGGNDTINGNNNDDRIYGGSGDDSINGGNGGDQLYGGSGNDNILGSGDPDLIIGGYGADTIDGGTGNDTFGYLSLLDTGDTIVGFEGANAASGDIIDFQAIYGGTLAWGGTTATASGVWYSVSGGNLTVYVDTDNNTSTAELAITVNSVTALGSGDFLL